jgi:hypothetical protein
MSKEEQSVEARVIQYGCLPPIQGADLVRSQMRAAHRYKNDLIALERCRREEYRKLRSRFGDLAPIEERASTLAQELTALREAIAAERKAERRRVTSELSSRAKDVHLELRAARQVLKEAQRAARANPELQAASRALDERATVWMKALRATTDCYWGTYLLVEAAIDQAKLAPSDPTFKRWRGEGSIGVQIQGGMSVAKLFGGQDRRLQIEPVPEDAWVTPLRGDRRRLSRTRLHIRIGSHERAPVWAVFPVILHRPLPEGARVKGAVVRVMRVGTDERWTVNLSYTREFAAPIQKPGLVALDIGWRKRPNSSLRVAYWVDDRGEQGEIVMDASIRERLKRARDLREIQDRVFNRAIRQLRRWLEAYSRTRHLPDFLREARGTLSSWRSHAMLSRVVLAWRDARFIRDDQIYQALERWRKRARHLYQWEANARNNALLARRG